MHFGGDQHGAGLFAADGRSAHIPFHLDALAGKVNCHLAIRLDGQL